MSMPADVYVEELSRYEMINMLSWNSGGMGYGICSFGTQMAMRMSGKEIPSIVVVSMPQEQYTDEELRKLVLFSTKMTEQFKRLVGGKVMLGDNCICIGKVRDQWLRKKLSWQYGSIYSPTLDEALAVFEREYK